MIEKQLIRDVKQNYTRMRCSNCNNTCWAKNCDLWLAKVFCRCPECGHRCEYDVDVD